MLCTVLYCLCVRAYNIGWGRNEIFQMKMGILGMMGAMGVMGVMGMGIMDRLI